MAMNNILSFDVEEWFQVELYSKLISRDDWDSYPLRVPESMAWILEALARNRVQATFFVLGWIAERLPALVKQIADEGHEVASHGWSHAPVWRLSPAEFSDEVRKSRDLLRHLSGQPVVGYRAPTFSITRETMWALPLLAEAGYQYDSSIFPVYHDRYGVPDAPCHIHRCEENIWEIPLSVWQVGKLRVPVAGGGYFRLYPHAVTKRAIRAINAAGRPAVVYLHPWEFDPDQPRVEKVGSLGTLRHRVGLGRSREKLLALMREFLFGTAGEALKAAAGEPALQLQ